MATTGRHPPPHVVSGLRRQPRRVFDTDASTSRRRGARPRILVGTRGVDVKSHTVITNGEMQRIFPLAQVDPDGVGLGVPGYVRHRFLGHAEARRLDRRVGPGQPVSTHDSGNHRNVTGSVKRR
jgi:hypothetical protein